MHYIVYDLQCLHYVIRSLTHTNNELSIHVIDRQICYALAALFINLIISHGEGQVGSDTILENTGLPLQATNVPRFFQIKSAISSITTYNKFCGQLAFTWNHFLVI